MLKFAKKLHCAEHDAAPRLGLRIVQADRDTPEACAEQIMELAREQISQVTCSFWMNSARPCDGAL